MNRTYYRGDMYFTDFGIGLGSEQMGYRPAVIIQNNTGNMYSSTVIVAAITSQKPQKTLLPTHYPIGAESGLETPSIILLEQIRTIDKQRILGYIGQTDSRTMQNINKAMRISLGFGCQNRYRVKNTGKEAYRNGTYRQEKK